MKKTPTSVAPAPRSSWGQERRLEFIDFRLRWEGRLNRSDLTEFFGISVPQASLDIAKYLELAPGRAHYDKSSRVYVADGMFSPLFAGNEPERYLSELLARKMGVVPQELSFLGWTPPLDIAPRPGRMIDAQTLKPILEAIRQHTSLAVVYQSMWDPAPVQRTIAPHALGHDGMRWHVRAYCYLRQKYLDFILGRITEVEPGLEAGKTGEDDVMWHRIVPLVLAPHPALSQSQQQAIARDFGMKDGTLAVQCRQALLFYTLRNLRLLREGVEAPQDQQITLQNRVEIAQFLPKDAQ
jgi:hypothetical protein